MVGGKKRKQWKWIFREDCVCMNEWWDCKRWSCLVSVFIVLLCFVFYCCFPFFLFLEIGRSALLCFFCGDVLIPVVFFFSDPLKRGPPPPESVALFPSTSYASSSFISLLSLLPSWSLSLSARLGSEWPPNWTQFSCKQKCLVSNGVVYWKDFLKEKKNIIIIINKNKVLDCEGVLTNWQCLHF